MDVLAILIGALGAIIIIAILIRLGLMVVFLGAMIGFGIDALLGTIPIFSCLGGGLGLLISIKQGFWKK